MAILTLQRIRANGETINASDDNNEWLNIINALSSVAQDKNIIIRLSDGVDPPLRLNQISSGPILQGQANGVNKFIIDIDGDLTANGIVGDAGIYTFNSIPIAPAADPTTANQLARKAYVDNRKIWWSMNWFIADPSTFPLNSFNLAQKVGIPDSNNFVATEIRAIFNTGTASGSLSVELRKHPFSNQLAQTVLGTATFNSGAVGVGAVFDINPDVSLTDGDWIYPVLTATSSPLQRDVSINLIGYQTPTS